MLLGPGSCHVPPVPPAPLPPAPLLSGTALGFFTGGSLLYTPKSGFC